MSERHDYEASAAVGGAGCMGQVRDQGLPPVVSTGSASPQAPHAGTAQAAGASSHNGQCYRTDQQVIVAPAGPHAPQNQRQWLQIPEMLRERPQWCVAAPSHLPDKRPYQCNGYPASVSDPSTWTTFDRATSYVHRHGGNVGFVLHASNGIVCCDLDVKDSTTAEQLQLYRAIVEGMGSWTEFSRSGRGLHVWALGSLPNDAGRRRDGVELYSHQRFMIVTGKVLDGYDLPLRDVSELLAGMVQQMSANTGHSAALVEVAPTRTDDAVWAALRRHEKFASKILPLCEGRWSELGYPSPSEADHALISYMANSTQSNEQVRRMFRQTKLAHCHRPSGNTGKHSKGDYHIDHSLKGIRAEQVARMNALQTLGSLTLPPAP